MPAMPESRLLDLSTALSKELCDWTGSESFPKSRRYTRQGWEHQRSIIKRHYLEESLTLKEVMGIMSTEYNFHPT
jgi:hypothetical protein